MGTASVLHILENPDREGLFWARRLIEDPLDQRALLVRENQHASVVMWLLRAWEEETSERSEYWVGNLWDIPVVRSFLKELKKQAQSTVLQSVLAAKPDSASLFNIQNLKQRDAEALRCFGELLEPGDEVMSLDSWRELCDICRTTFIEVGSLPWHLKILSESDRVPNNIQEIWIPQAQQISKLRWPSWLKDCSLVCATASRQDDRGLALMPDFSLAQSYRWKIAEAEELAATAVVELESTTACFKLRGKRLQYWQDQLESHVFSATELETYIRSPYAYYCERVLKLRQVKQDSWDLDAAEIGVLAHNVLENYYSQHSEAIKTKNFDRQAGFDRLDRLLEDGLKGLKAERPGLENRLVARQQQRVQRALHAVLAKDIEDIHSQDSPLYPKYFEWSFGMKEVPPLELPGNIQLRGTIDRIDVDPVKKTFLIIDYKTGSRAITGNDIERGDSLQLPLYIEAVRQHLLPDHTPIGALFFSLGDMSKKNGILRLDYASDYFELSMRSSSLMAPAKWQEVIDNTLEQARQTVEAIRSGSFPRCDGICASYCPYQDMCGCGVLA